MNATAEERSTEEQLHRPQPASLLVVGGAAFQRLRWQGTKTFHQLMKMENKSAQLGVQFSPGKT